LILCTGLVLLGLCPSSDVQTRRTRSGQNAGGKRQAWLFTNHALN
jgi:hypothetical protein